VATGLNDVYFFTRVAASERLHVLTIPDFHRPFTRATASQIERRVRVELLPLPSLMQQMVNGVTALAS